MMNAKNLVREAGYETLFLSGLFLGMALRPGFHNYERVFDWYCDARANRRSLQRLEARGVIQSGHQTGRWVPRLTKLGRAAFSGGRDPHAAWNREWDGLWRLLTFDIPRKDSRMRMKLARWLRANHFGHIQGSVWIHPDPVSEVRDIIEKDRLHPKTVMIFEGSLPGTQDPREVAATGWDFHSINTAYQNYIDFTEQARHQLSNKPSTGTLRNILHKERQCWLEAVQLDPLLPTPVIPKGYAGSKAWKKRQKLLATLHENFRRQNSIRKNAPPRK